MTPDIPSRTPPTSPAEPGPDPTQVRYLSPAACSIHVGIHGALHVTIENERTYGGVYAAYVFPVEHADQFISLLQSTGEREDFEIGVIRDLNTFPAEQAELVRQALARRHFIHTITRIYEVGWEHGLVSFDVETDKGRAQFLLRWKTDRAVDYGRRGKVLTDVDENRYVIPDLDELSPGERNSFTRIIYW